MLWEKVVLKPLTDSPFESAEVMNKKDKMVYRIWVGIWIGVNFLLWSWWLQGKHVASPILFVIATLMLFYESTLLPSFYLFYLGKMRQPPRVTPQNNLRVAMVTAIVPNKESISVLEKTLNGMIAVTYTHDNWVLDEGNDLRVKGLCQRFGVNHFSRKGVSKYNQESYPFKAKTKAGNYNAWLDSYGYESYDIVVQLDTDHVPIQDYLDEVLGHFRDPNVAWVQAPSLYGNFESWTARGSSEQELVLQGPLQMGFYGFCQTPFIIGSHTTLRVKALRAIGGFAETRAEDHLNTVKLASHGYRGVFVPRQIATGMGPEDFDTYAAQQFAWAYSMIQIMLHYAPKYARKYTFKQMLQFIFVQTWYALWGTVYGVLFLLPILALTLNEPIASVPFFSFTARYLLVLATAFAVFVWSRKWFQPKGLFLSWRGIILQIARWPIVLWALINAMLNVKHSYMITPKGVYQGERRPFRLEVHLPYLLFCTVALGASLYFAKITLKSGPSNAQGYLLYTIQGLTMMLGVYLTILWLDIRAMRREGVKLLRGITLRLKALFISLLLISCTSITLVSATQPIVTAVAWSPQVEKEEVASLTQPISSVEAISRQVLPEPIVLAVIPKPTPTPTSTPTPTPIPPTPTPTPIPPTPTPTPIPVVNLPNNGAVLGAYDPDGLLSSVDQIAIEHEFVSWKWADNLEATITQIRSRGRFPLITIEPDPLGKNGLRKASLFNDILEGSYDETIMALAQSISGHTPQPILIRWGHEMELTGLYPWSQENPEGYIAAYRYFVDFFREKDINNVFWVWSPAGNIGNEKYYPGDDYVDFVGITILADEGWDKRFGINHPRSFVELMNEKYYLAETFDKPIIVAEMGVSGSVERKTEWLKWGFASFDYYPQLWGLVYYNDRNRANPITDSTPDWKITESIFLEALVAPESEPTTE
jgi:cellulose synthase (UDP-forming)